MPPGVPVMTVAINGAKNAAFAACEILALLYPTIGTQLEYFRAKTREELEAKSKKLKQQEEK
jgi:5-(carboxyamino)imidazole ribonucleotide mutase